MNSKSQSLQTINFIGKRKSLLDIPGFGKYPASGTLSKSKINSRFAEAQVGQFVNSFCTFKFDSPICTDNLV